MRQYLDLLQEVLDNGVVKDDRTGTGIKEVFGRTMRFDLSEGFPLVTTKLVFWRGVVEELLWMVVRGSTDVTELEDVGVKIWSAWKKEDGTIGPGYGEQFRRQRHLCDNGGGGLKRIKIDQVQELIESIKTNPNSRRHVISLWNPKDLPDMALPPCHGVAIEFNVTSGKLSCMMLQRSADLFLGVPFNIAFYSLFAHMIAQVCDLEVGEFIHVLGSAHIYLNHVDQVKLQLRREPLELPRLLLKSGVKDINDFVTTDITLEGYKPHPGIKGKVAV